MLRALTLAAVAAIVSAAGSGATRTPGAAVPRGCPAGRVEAVDAAAVVVRRAGTLYGCLRTGGRPVALGGESCLGPGRPMRASGPRLAGAAVAFVRTVCGVDTGRSEVVAINLRSGRTLRRAPAALRSPGPEAFTAVTALVVGPRGDMAWISSTRSIARHATSTELDRVNGRGATVLDSGADVSGLTLSERVLRWRSSGRERSAALG